MKLNDPVLLAGSRMLERSRNRREGMIALSEAEDQYTKICSTHSSENTEAAIKLAKAQGLEAKLYAECKLAVTGKKEKVLRFQQLLRKMIMGEELPPTEGVHLVKDLSMAHDMLPPGRMKTRVALAMQELSGMQPVSRQRMTRYRAMHQQLMGYALGTTVAHAPQMLAAIRKFVPEWNKARAADNHERLLEIWKKVCQIIGLGSYTGTTGIPAKLFPSNSRHNKGIGHHQFPGYNEAQQKGVESMPYDLEKWLKDTGMPG